MVAGDTTKMGSEIMARLDGKTALVTGAGRGIGRDIAKRLAEDGARVAINYSRSKAEAEDLVREIEAAGGSALVVGGDVSDLAAIAAIFDDLKSRLGHLDILVNNAGRGAAGAGALATATPEGFDAVFALNTFVTQAAVKMMRDGGRVINISSTSTRSRTPGLSPYAASKSAVDAFTRGWSAELAPRKITVNSVLPGIVDTDLISGMTAEMKAHYVSIVPLGRIGQPRDIANVVSFLASDDSAWMTGQELLASGGA
jgi:3-oxoacyl-[acyl-carrier protein] reductase